jgi:hypothetical protein
MEKIIDLHPNQWKVWADPSRFRVLVAGRRFGKTTLAVNELLQCAIQNPGTLSFYISPTYKQSKQIAWRMLKQSIPEELVEKANESDLAVTLTNGSVIELKGCDTPDSLRGVGVSFIVVDEFASIPDGESLWGEVLRPMLIDTKGRGLFIGTPKGLNAFHTMFEKGNNEEDGFKSFRFTSYDNPYLEKHEIDLMRDELTEEIFQQEVMTSFLVSSDSTLIKLENIEALKGVQIFEEDMIRHISCDPALLGGDECVIQVFENTRVIERKALHYNDTQKIAVEIVMLANKYDVVGISIDCVGIGKGVADAVTMMVKDRPIKVLQISSGSESSNSDKFANLKAEMWWYVWDQIKNAKVVYPEDINIRRQLSSVQYTLVNSNGKIGLVPKKKTKSLLGRSPDDADTFVYGIWGLKHFSPRKKLAYQSRAERWHKKPVGYGWQGAMNGV